MKHSTRNSSNGRFIKQITVEQTKPVKPVPVVQIFLALVVLAAALIIIDKYITPIF